MLHYLDVAIGFTLAMMVLATLVGTTTAMWLAGRHGLFRIYGDHGSGLRSGVWTTFILVSLGVPFWRGLLDKLLGLRSKIAAKTENERAQRAAQT